MVEEFRSGFALDAHHSSVGMVRIRVETNHPAVLDGCDGGAVGRTESAIATDRIGRCSEISHRQQGTYSKACEVSSWYRTRIGLDIRSSRGLKKNGPALPGGFWAG